MRLEYNEDVKFHRLIGISIVCVNVLSVLSVFAFTDTSDSIHETAINSLYNQGIVQGYSDGTFQADRQINRAEFLKILVEAEYPDQAEGIHCFSDVQSDWYSKYVCFAKELSIVEGYGDNTFKPGNTINLVEALKILFETYKINTCKSCYSLWYEAYLEEAINLNWLNNLSQVPSHEMTRGEAAQLIYNVTIDKEDTCQTKLFGFWGLNGSFADTVDETTGNLQDLANGTGMNAFVVATSPSYAINKQLPSAAAAGLTAMFRMSGGNSQLVDASGNFDIGNWESLVSSWASSDLESQLQPYLGGELKWHMLLDDIDTFDDDFGGQNPTANELANMAEYSKSLFPAIKTFIRQDADQLPSGSYTFLDAVLNQYTARKGALNEYISSNLSAASAIGVDSIWGLNIVDGGDGSSGQPGLATGKYLMSPDEIRSYGESLLNATGSLGLLMWKYDDEETLSDGKTIADHFSSASYQSAFADLAVTANCE